jgi:hypothetical protein
MILFLFVLLIGLPLFFLHAHFINSVGKPKGPVDRTDYSLKPSTDKPLTTEQLIEKWKKEHPNWEEEARQKKLAEARRALAELERKQEAIERQIEESKRQQAEKEARREKAKAERLERVRALNVHIPVPEKGTGPDSSHYYTEDWKRKSKACLHRAKYICKRCHGPATVAHHTSYKYIGTRYEYY